MLGDLADWVNVLDTVRTELDVGGEKVNTLVLVERRVDKGWLDDALLALSGLEQALGETGSGHGHGESGGSGTALGLDDLVTTELDALDVLIALGALERVTGLGEERNNGGSGVTTDDGDGLVGWVGALELGDEAGSTHDIEGGDTEELLWVVDVLGLEDLGGDWNGGVDLEDCELRSSVVSCRTTTYWVGDDQDVGVRAMVGACLGELADDGGVGVEQVWIGVSVSIVAGKTSKRTITGHAWLARNTSWDENNLAAGQALLDTAVALWVVTLDLLDCQSQSCGPSSCFTYNALGVDVGDISSDT